MEMILNYLHQGFSAVGPFIILLGLLIFVHELGHFLVAIWSGVRVEVFSLGFGKKLFQKKHGDTVYAISLIPLGGYVKMFGDEVGAAISEEDKKFSFTHKPVWKRIAIVLAGPLMNFFFAIFIFAIVSGLGEEVRSPILGDISKESSAFQLGFRSGDKILAVNEKEIRTWDDFQNEININVDRQVSLKIVKEGSINPEIIKATPKLKPNPNLLSLDEFIGEIDGVSNQSYAAAIGVRTNSYAEKLGLKTGDRITSVNGNEISQFRQLENYFVNLQDQNIEVIVDRMEEKKSSIVKLSGKLGKFSEMKILGIESPDLYLAKVLPDSPAAQAGLQSGDRVVAINDKEPKVWEDILNTVKSYNGQGVIKLKVERKNDIQSVEITPKMTSHMNQNGGEEKRYTLGIMPWIMSAPPAMINLKSTNPVQAVQRGFKKTVDVSVMTVVSFLRLIQAKISPKNIGGVISIGQAASETFKIGITHFLQMMAIISVNLFVLNLLPIPVLDGGHLLFYTLEAIKGAPISMRKMEIAQQFGLVVLLSLMVFALFNDFSRLLGFW